MHSGSPGTPPPSPLSRSTEKPCTPRAYKIRQNLRAARYSVLAPLMHQMDRSLVNSLSPQILRRRVTVDLGGNARIAVAQDALDGRRICLDELLHPARRHLAYWHPGQF